ncbi:MAG: DUF1353 domain-containing protein [Pseudomonas aeruginosa]
MSSFTSFDGTSEMSISYAARASKEAGRDLWVVNEPFSYYVGKKEDNVWVHVPAGYLTDGATVPRLFWWLIPPLGQYGQASVLHDYLREKRYVLRNDVEVMLSIKETDDIFLEAMTALEVPAWKRYLMYSAVRVYAEAKAMFLRYQAARAA